MRTREPLFIASKAEVDERLQSLKFIRETSEWESVYLDQETGLAWFNYPLWDQLGGVGPRCLRRVNPTPNEALAAISDSTSDSEVAAAALYLRYNCPGGEENLVRIVVGLEEIEAKLWSQRQARNVALAVAWTNVAKPFNYRNPVGKGNAEVVTDFKYWQGLAARAAGLKTRAEAMIGETVTRSREVFK